MQYSANLHLNLPEDTDPLEVSKLSENFETLDGAISEAGAIAAQKAFKVGDTLTTWRTDLGDNWLLCNGEAFDPDEYPKLAEVCPDLVAMAELVKWGPENPNEQVIDSAQDISQGYIGIIKDNGNVEFYKDTLDNLVHTDKIAISSSRKYRIWFENGYWVAVSEQNYYYKNSATADFSGPVILPQNPDNPEHFEYFDGNYYIFGHAYILYSNSINFSGAVTITVEKLYNKTTAFFIRGADKFVYVYTTGSGKLSNIKYSSDPRGSFTLREVATPLTELELNRSYFGSGYFDGKYVILAGDTVAGDNRGIWMVWFDEPDGEIHNTKLSNIWFTQPGAYIYKLSTGDYIITHERNSEHAAFMVSKSLLGETPYKPISVYYYSDPEYTYVQYARHGVFEFNNFLNYNASRYVSSSYKYNFVQIPLYAVPRIDAPQSYTYIKSKEETTNVNQQTDTPAS